MASIPRGFAVWHRPPPGFIKINVDRDFSFSDEKHGIRVIARNNEGVFILARSKILWFNGSAELVEARVVLWALDLAKEQGWQNVVIEGDCNMVVEALSSSRHRAFHVQTVINNCLAFSHDFASVISILLSWL